jgi:16S rRNA (uracil1498-N3)-methyltransferase
MVTAGKRAKRVFEVGPRIYFPQALCADERYILTGDQHRHVSQVLRLKAGAALTLFDGTGGEYAAVIEEVNRANSSVRTGEYRSVDKESPLQLRLAQGIGRGERTDFAIQKAVELGVTSIVPVLTRRGMVRLDAQRAKRRLAHWHGIIVHACQQCGRNRLPELGPVIALNDWLRDYQRGGLDLTLDPSSTTGVDELEHTGGLITLLVGPEGGLDGKEREASYAAGFVGVTLGPRTLRTETAAIAGVTAVQLRWGDLDRGN